MKFKRGMKRVALLLGVAGALVGLYGTFICWDGLHEEASGGFSPATAPAAWQYALTLTLPIIGFVIPWGVTLAVTWVVSGFIEPKEDKAGV